MWAIPSSTIESDTAAFLIIRIVDLIFCDGDLWLTLVLVWNQALIVGRPSMTFHNLVVVQLTVRLILNPSLYLIMRTAKYFIGSFQIDYWSFTFEIVTDFSLLLL